MAKNMPKIAEVKLSRCGLEKKLQLWNCGVVVVEQHFFKKFRNCDCGLKKAVGAHLCLF
jgi:hypothetical protein